MNQRVVFILAITVVSLGRSQPAGADDLPTARQHYDKGTALYDLQRYAEAAREYELAFEAKQDPALLFNIGQAYRFANQYVKAIGAFRSYLRRLPNAENRLDVETRIAEMQRLLDEQRRSHEQPPGGIAPLPRPTVEQPVQGGGRPAEPALPVRSHREEERLRRSARTKTIAGIATCAVGVALLAAGGGFAAAANSASNQLNHPADGVFNPSAEDRRNTYQALDAVAFAVGGAAVAAGVTVLVIGWHESRSLTLAPRASCDGAGLLVSGSF
jgi:tetratricopeptide (TPR) repeat protein